jgi:hypothetical protein
VKPPSYIANFDSASAMVRATARYLKGKDFPALGLGAPVKYPPRIAKRLPRRAREIAYAYNSAGEAIRPSFAGRVNDEAVARWITSTYPKRYYPAAVVGSSSGALVHLAAALGMPWLPQTYLIGIRQPDAHPDEPRRGLEKSLKPGRKLLESNPDLQLHVMHDPNQDRLTLTRMQYFRVKWRRMPDTYRRWLSDVLPAGGTLFISECRRTWPQTKVDDRFYYQFGALGGATEEEFFTGGPRVEEYLRHYQSDRGRRPRRNRGEIMTRWDPPAPDGDFPEAEWGFEPAVTDDLLELAAEHRWNVRRIVFDEPEHLSPLVAELYRWWYRQRRLSPNRLLVDSFLLMDPWWTLRLGAAPLWLKFNMEPSAEALERYLAEFGPFDDIRMMLFAHGVECVGLPPIDRWKASLAQARDVGAFLDVDEDAYPLHFDHMGRYHDALQDVPARYPMPGYLALAQLEEFLDEQGDRFPVAWPKPGERAPQPTQAAASSWG